jgi:hypothetical protein
MPAAVALCHPGFLPSLQALLMRFGLQVERLDLGAAIPGSYRGDGEAGLIGNVLYPRDDTPLHSTLHETCHFICMDDARRAHLDSDAVGELPEEHAVRYLQAPLADRIPGYDRHRMFTDMDAWDYSFRLGCAESWFERDATDARSWLVQNHIINRAQQPTGRLRRQSQKTDD